MKNGRHLPTLDGWRAIAILIVVVSHSLTTGSAATGGPVALLLFRLGTFGVMLFFAISGFLICTRLLDEADATGTISLRSFYVRRVFRILPAAYAYLLTIVALSFLGILHAGWSDIAGAAFFYGNYLRSDSWFTGHFWSLALEEHFYLLWPPILVFFGAKRALWTGVGLVALTAILRQLAIGRDLPGATHLRLDAFMFPCILAILLHRVRAVQGFLLAITPRTWCLLLLALAVGVAVSTALPGWREPQRLFQSAVIPVIVATTVTRPDDWFARQLSRPAVEWLGEPHTVSISGSNLSSDSPPSIGRPGWWPCPS